MENELDLFHSQEDSFNSKIKPAARVVQLSSVSRRAILCYKDPQGHIQVKMKARKPPDFQWQTE
ncbi:hypothetical protein HPP92_018782 [Vanilla planifolia]|uniref:Uncharacterized protein n=1 Tax=Vanilla planifolia TaxID=51239 RepID=A0A835QG98_VANPL|nr:hypothetical protein HPP92_018782 [Vanilla planifolia]